MKIFKKLFSRDKKIIQNRKVTKARFLFLYLYVIFGSVSGLSYFIASIFLGWVKHFALSPVYLLFLFFILRFFYRNWRLIWMYIIDMERGKLLLYLNKRTHWSEEHKMKVIKWVYLGRRKVRNETQLKIAKKVMDKQELTDKEKKYSKYTSVFCPQQVKDGFNEAMLVDALIYAHTNIQVLDDELRDIMNLTDDHILKFDLRTEYLKAGGEQYEKYREIGKRKSEELNK
jgi:hypothetical protein